MSLRKELRIKHAIITNSFSYPLKMITVAEWKLVVDDTFTRDVGGQTYSSRLLSMILTSRVVYYCGAERERAVVKFSYIVLKVSCTIVFMNISLYLY